MKNNHAGAIKGLSIAAIVLSAIGIVGAILIMVFSGVLSAVVLGSGPDIVYELNQQYGDPTMHYGGFDADDAFIVSTIMMLVGGGVAIWALVCCVVTLMAGIFGVMHCANPAKLGFVMGWAIAGAIVGFLGGNLVTVVLLIIVAVFANSDKRIYRDTPQPPIV